MEQDDFKAMWNKLFEESLLLEDRRVILETELSEVKARIEHVDGLLNHLRPLAGIPLGDEISGLGITDAIRAILRNSKERMSPADVRRALTSKGFDLSQYSAPMSSIYKILGRLADNPEQVIREKDDNGVFYRWKRDDLIDATEITDDDIPF